MTPLLFLALMVAEAPKVEYHTYWLEEVRKEPSNGYQHLIVTIGPLSDWSGRKLPAAKLALDHPAVTFMTHGRDSLWSDPFHCVAEFGKIDEKTVVADGKTYTFEECSVDVLVKLLEKPLGTRPIHRRMHPLQDAERTAKAFAQQLKDSAKK